MEQVASSKSSKTWFVGGRNRRGGMMIMPGGLLHILAAQYFKSSLPAVGGIRSIRNWITIDNLFFLLSWKIVMITLDYTQIVASNAFGFAREDREQTSTQSLKINQKSRISYFHQTCSMILI